MPTRKMCMLPILPIINVIVFKYYQHMDKSNEFVSQFVDVQNVGFGNRKICITSIL